MSTPERRYSLMIHGGAGNFVADEAMFVPIHEILTAGEELLRSGVSSLDVVQRCVELLEDEPRFNAGRGSVFNSQGEVEMDAAIMNGQDMRAGGVAGVRGVRNPIQLARKVMDESGNVLLIGDGAEEFGREVGVMFADADYFLTEERLLQWEKIKGSAGTALDHSEPIDEGKYGTVGAVAFDREGNLAAATSTGGMWNKQYGRVGDSPIVGAGVYAENETCAVSATGYGEHFLRTSIAKTIAEIVRYEKVDAQTAATRGVEFLVRKVSGLGGVIVIGRDGSCGLAHSTKILIYGRVREGESCEAGLQA